jgi:serine protease Do
MDPLQVLATISDGFVKLVERAVPAVVAVHDNAAETADGRGSGFLVDRSGHVVTNFHVIEGLADVWVVPSGRLKVPARVVGSDPLTDLAVLHITDSPGHLLSLREDQPARLGELCIALGSPFGMYPESAAMGIVSGVTRTIQNAGHRPIERAIQTDCAINPGNSGGPLIDVHGEVIGVNTCIDRRAEGIGFAVPADTVAWVADELIAHGRVQRAALGVGVANRTVTLDGQPAPRLVVTRTSSAGSALRADDVILTINGEIIDERSDLYRYLTKEHIGTPLRFEVLRNGEPARVEVTPTALP